MDNLYNAKADVADRIKAITNKDFVVYHEDVCDKETMHKIFSEHKVDTVIHFAGYKAVGESVKKPIMYYENNLISTLVLCDTMKKYECKNLVFSSSATVYGDPSVIPWNENSQLGPTTNPYGSTKLMIENILRGVYT